MRSDEAKRISRIGGEVRRDERCQGKYIHYGNRQFDPLLFREVRNRRYWNKPYGGFWASPADASFGWREWCEREGFRKCDEENRFLFSLRKDANVYEIHSLDDMMRLPMAEPGDGNYFDRTLREKIAHCIDYEKCLGNGIDAIELFWSDGGEQEFGSGLKHWMTEWDCDSILIMNKDVIVAPDGET